MYIIICYDIDKYTNLIIVLQNIFIINNNKKIIEK